MLSVRKDKVEERVAGPHRQDQDTTCSVQPEVHQHCYNVVRWRKDVVAYVRRKFLCKEIVPHSSWVLSSGKIEREFLVPKLSHRIH